MDHKLQGARGRERSPGRSDRSSPAAGDAEATGDDAEARGDETDETSAWTTDGSGLQVRNIIALRRWPPGTAAIEQSRRGRAVRTASRPPRTGLAAWILQRVNIALERTRCRDRFWQRVQLELEKARRHDRRFVLARLRFDAGAGKQLGDDLPRGLRYEDAVLVADGSPDEVLVLLAEADGPAAERVLERLERQFSTHRLRTAAVAAFPADGFTCGALVDALYAPGGSTAVPAGARRDRAGAEPNQVAGA